MVRTMDSRSAVGISLAVWMVVQVVPIVLTRRLFWSSRETRVAYDFFTILSIFGTLAIALGDWRVILAATVAFVAKAAWSSA
jgi:hypothetical protein